jgi:ApbE superfamily uncharacterized protein (UPF0280 family)
MTKEAAACVIQAAFFVTRSTTRGMGDEVSVFVDEVSRANAAAREIDASACDIADETREIDAKARDTVDEVIVIEAAIAVIEAAARGTNAEASGLVDAVSRKAAGLRPEGASLTRIADYRGSSGRCPSKRTTSPSAIR